MPPRLIQLRSFQCRLSSSQYGPQRLLSQRRRLLSSTARSGGSNTPEPNQAESDVSELKVGEIDGVKFRVEPLRRTGEDLRTMRARLLCGHPSHFRYPLLTIPRPKQKTRHPRERPTPLDLRRRTAAANDATAVARVRPLLGRERLGHLLLGDAGRRTGGLDKGEGAGAGGEAVATAGRVGPNGGNVQGCLPAGAESMEGGGHSQDVAGACGGKAAGWNGVYAAP
jgi:hypothetical protein